MSYSRLPTIAPQFVYEPHIAPRLELLKADWVQRRRMRQRNLAAASYSDEDDEHAHLQGRARSDTEPVELDTLPTSISASGVESTMSEHLLQRRRWPSGPHESLMLEQVRCPYSQQARTDHNNIAKRDDTFQATRTVSDANC